MSNFLVRISQPASTYSTQCRPREMSVVRGSHVHVCGCGGTARLHYTLNYSRYQKEKKYFYPCFIPILSNIWCFTIIYEYMHIAKILMFTSSKLLLKLTSHICVCTCKCSALPSGTHCSIRKKSGRPHSEDSNRFNSDESCNR